MQRIKLFIYDKPLIALGLLALVFLVGGFYLSQVKESWDKRQYEAAQEKTQGEVREAEAESQKAQGRAEEIKDEGKRKDADINTRKAAVERSRKELQEAVTRPAPTPDPVRQRDRAEQCARAERLGLPPC